MVSNCPVSNCPGVKLSGVKLSAVSNCPRCQIVCGVKLSVVSNCPVSNCPRCQIVCGVKLSWCQIVLGSSVAKCSVTQCSVGHDFRKFFSLNFAIRNFFCKIPLECLQIFAHIIAEILAKCKYLRLYLQTSEHC